MKLKWATSVVIASFFAIAMASLHADLTKTAKPATAPAQTRPAPQPAQSVESPQLAALHKKLLGTWYGPSCGGDYTFNADGTYEVHNFTPGNNTLTGTWSVRWDNLRPVLVLLCKTSDFKKNDASRPEYENLGKPVEVRLLELSNEALALQQNAEWISHYSRKNGEGGWVTPGQK